MKRSVSFRSRTTCLATGELIDALCIVFGRTPLDMSVIDDEIQNAIKTRSPVPDVIALTSFGDQADQLAQIWKANPERAATLIRRGRSERLNYLKELGIWSFRGGSFDLIHRDAGSKTCYKLAMPTLLRAGLAWLVDETKAFQVAPSGHIFRHPSKRQSKYFLLASELVRDEVDAYFVGLCICQIAWQRLSGANTLHIDTMGIYAVARAVEDIASKSGGRYPAPWQIDSFHSQDGIAGLHAVVGPQEAVLISASTSGSMAARLADEGVPDAALITLLDVSERDRHSAVVYARDRHFPTLPTDAVAVTRGGTDETVIELTGEYFVATGKKPRALLLSKDHRPGALGTLLNHFGGSAVCGLNKHRSGASNAVDTASIDGSQIAANPEFKKWVADEIRAKTPVSISHVMHLPGTGSEALAIDCADTIALLVGKRPSIISGSEPVGLTSTAVLGVLVCAALVGNGHALRAASRDLREAVPTASRHFLVGVGLPASDEAWTRLRQFLIQSGDPLRPYQFSHWLVLPTGSEAGPGETWVRSNAVMQRTEQLQVRADSPWNQDVVAASLKLAGDALDSATAGFLTASTGEVLRLTRGFVYWSPRPEVLASADHATASYLAMASALQASREFKDHARCLRSTLHETVVLDPENFLRFNDGVLQASLLRAARAHELDYSAAPELSEIMREFLEKVFNNHHRSYGEAAPEFALALASGQLRLAAKDAHLLLTRLESVLTEASSLLGVVYCAWHAHAP